MMSHNKISLLIVLFAIVSTTSSAYDTCGDGMCGSTESSYNCKEDCPSGAADLFCDPNQGGNDPDCTANEATLPGTGVILSSGTDKNYVLKLVAGIIAVVVLCVVVFLFIRKVRKQGGIPREQYYPQNYQTNQGYYRR